MPSTVAWPSTLPSGPASFSETRKPNVVMTQPDDGPSKTRRRFTKAVYLCKMSFLLTVAQRNTLDTFYDVTLDGGVNHFTFLHPWLGSSKTFKMKGPPDYSDSGPLGVSASFSVEWS